LIFVKDDLVKRLAEAQAAEGAGGVQLTNGGEQEVGAAGPQEGLTGGSIELPTLGARSKQFKTPFL
jgi:hypothetical protein